jgi:Phage integrase family
LLALGLSRCALHIANCLAIQPGDRLELRDALVQAVDLCLRGHQRVSGQNVQPITRNAECGDKLANMGLEAFLRNLDDACRFQRLPFILRVLLLTLQRRSELALAEWREFDFKAKTWTIPDAHAKTGKEHVVPLSDWAIQDLEKLKVMAGGSIRAMSELCPE